MIAGRSAESIRVIESLPEKEQEFWQSMMLALESYRGSHDSTALEQLTETLEYVRTASRPIATIVHHENSAAEFLQSDRRFRKLQRLSDFGVQRRSAIVAVCGD